MKMNRLSIFSRFTLTLFALFLTANLWGQTLSGAGTKESPYLITSTADWNEFATEANAAKYWAIGVYVRLDADITVSTMAGTNSHKYQGTFDGNWHKLTFNKGSMDAPCQVEKCAPFSFAGPGLTIKNLTVEGTIISQKKFAAGLIGWVEGAGTYHITNCTNNITINCSKIEKGTNSSKYWDCSTGGFIGQIETGTVYFTNCIFTGSILKDTQSSANRCAGFVSYNGGSITYTNCTMAGTIDMANNYSTFNRNARNSFIESYFINSYGDVPTTGCAQAPTTAPSDKITKKYTVSETDYYVPNAAITGLETTTYSYTGNVIVITPIVTYYGWTMTKDTDYEISYEKKNGDNWESVAVIQYEGDYRFIISGKGDYSGSYTSPTIQVVEYKTWNAVKTILADDSQGDRIITLSGDIYPENPSGADVALVVNGNVVLNMAGHTIDRKLYTASPVADPVVKGQVIRVSSGASLTINGGSSRNAIKGGYNYANGTDNDAGGIYNMGNLVLNNVNINHNGCTKGNQSATSATARGGGVYSGSGSSLVINGGSIESNDAKGGGGGVCSDGANPFTITNTSVSYNQSESKGGGIRVKTTGKNVAYLTNCSILLNLVTDNTADGGGVYMEGGELHMTNCEIMGNQSRYRGCGFFSIRGTTEATDCDISYNGSFSVEDNNLGGGVCLYDNKNSDHSIFIMDGGTIEANNSNAHGGGIYVFDGAVFKIKGNVQILDNYMASVATGASNNNAYLDGTAYIEVISPGLGNDAIINITPHGGGGVAVEFAAGASSGSVATDLSHFQLDGSDYNLIIDDKGNIESYVPSAWNNPDTWNNSTIAVATDLNEGIPTSSSEITIHRAVKIPSNVTANAGTITCDAFCDIIIEDGAQLITNSSNVAVLAKKSIGAAHEEDQTGWYLIASPVNDPNIENSTNLITKLYDYYDTYDLYRFNESAELQWENYRAGHGDFTTLQNGRGYLYRNADDHTIDIGGTLNVSDITYNLSCSGSGDLKGFNLIGNPYSQNITLLNTTLVNNSSEAISTQLTGFYRLTANGSTWTSEITSGDAATIAPLEGFLVQVPEAAKKVKFSKTARGAKRSNGDNIKFTVANSQYEDVAYALFENGLGLNKIEHMNEDVPMVYINRNEEDFAIATLNDEVKQFNLNFEAKTTGKYTLKVEKTGAYSYLHLIDKVAEKDINLLEENEYSFVGSPADKADRFIVRLELSEDAENSVFAYQSGNEIVVSGEGELQVFDVMGRLVMQKHVSGVESIATPMTTGVYILRLNENTQKIVVR